MALCPQCHGEMDQAQAACPHCGCDAAQSGQSRLSRLVKPFLWLCFLLAGPLGLFYLIWWPAVFREFVFPFVSLVPPQTYFNQPPPELAIGGQWINSAEPLTLESLRGNVVWIEFSFSRCGGCIAMKPQLVQWHELYADEGLVIIDVHNGKVDEQWYSDPLANLEKNLSEAPVPFAVLFDEDGTTCDRYGVQGYPWGFLIDRRGRVVWQDAPNGNQSRVEGKIREALHAR